MALIIWRVFLGTIVLYYGWNGLNVVEMGYCDTLTATCY